jgi:hypothetical protein
MTTLILTFLPVLVTFGIAAFTPPTETRCHDSHQPC